MSQQKRVVIAVVIIIGLVLLVVTVDLLQRRAASQELAAGSIPIYFKGRLVDSFLPTDLEELTQVSFVDDEEGKTQEGWMLRDILLLHLEADKLENTEITVSSSSREKSITLAWDEVDTAENMVMFDLSNRGTLKLVSKLPGFDLRDSWVQDVDRIDVD